jgi:hypothetical protein
VRFLIEESQDEKREKVEEGTGTKQMHRIELNPKVIKGRRQPRKERRLTKEGERNELSEFRSH